MLTYILPVMLIVAANTFYQVCAKSTPTDLHPLASLTITYLVGAALSAVFYHVLQRGSILREYAHLNWAPFALGLAVAGLELGNILAYRAGWPVSALSIVQGSFVAICLLGVGYVLYQEPITANKVLGIIICLIGLWFLNRP